MKPEDMQKKFGPILLLIGIAIGLSLFFGSDNDKYKKTIDDAVKKQQEQKQKSQEK